LIKIVCYDTNLNKFHRELVAVRCPVRRSRRFYSAHAVRRTAKRCPTSSNECSALWALQWQSE